MNINLNILFALSYLLFCNVLHIWHIRAIPTYRVHRLYDNMDECGFQVVKINILCFQVV